MAWSPTLRGSIARKQLPAKKIVLFSNDIVATKDTSKTPIYYALGANGGIAKFAAAFFTGSDAMLAEAIHSLADCTN